MELLPVWDTKALMDMSSQCFVISSGSLSVKRPFQGLCLHAGSSLSMLCLGLAFAESRSSYRCIPWDLWTCQREREGIQVWDVNLTHSHKIKMTAVFTVLRMISFLRLIILWLSPYAQAICNHIFLFPIQCNHKHTQLEASVTMQATSPSVKRKEDLVWIFSILNTSLSFKEKAE